VVAGRGSWATESSPRGGGYLRLVLQAASGAIDTTRCNSWAGLTLLYVGISPKAPPASGLGASRQHLRRRLRQHYALNAYGSSLRLTLGCLLADQLGLVLRRADGEARLSRWMADDAFVCWVAHDRPWELEDALVKTLDLPLNLQAMTAILSAHT
jgi:GIY-YIG catalytic domain